MYCIVIIFLSLEGKNNLYLSLVLTFKFFLFNFIDKFLCIKILDTYYHRTCNYFCVHFLDRITCRNLYMIIMYNKKVYLFMVQDV